MCCLSMFSGLPSPSKHYSLRVDNAVPMVTQPPQALQLQPQLIAQQQVQAQQFVPVSVMEQNGRQMLVTMRMKTKNVFYMFTSVRWWKQGVGRGTALLCTVRISWVLRKLDFRIFSTQIKSTCERN